MNSDTALADRKPQASRPPRLWLRFAIVIIGLGLLASGLIAFQRFKAGIIKQVVTSIVSQRPTVATAAAVTLPWQTALTATGTLRASRGADLAAEVSGIVDELNIPSGTDVAAGTVLLRLRPNDDDAKLEQLRAAADLAAITYQRDLKQVKEQAIAQSTVDSDAATLRSDRAQVLAQQALMAEKVVRAPFAGRLGIRQVDLGQYLTAGSTIVTLQALDPIFIDVYIPQSYAGQIMIGQAVTVHTDDQSDARFAGEVTAVNAKADSSSRMVMVRISLHNSDGKLLPGMYATAEIALGAPQQRVTVPAAAISVNPYGSLVYVVQPQGGGNGAPPTMMVRQQFVTTGETRGDQVSIVKGLEAGDQIVVAGQLKLRNNIAVLINDSVQPADDATPTPADH
ncbi:MAG: efflux RND transporter periplasmic adaptor subunit [Azospirillaceae bacterium]|nr:efflux RND transporter periplasmic adaptor subunit [Azospirillaceae bacterium]